MRGKIITNLLLAIISTIALAACRDNTVNDCLNRVDDIMETDPERALSMLDSLNPAAFTTADSAYYALLHTQAQIKNDITVTSDTLINQALTYYTDHGPSNHVIRANYLYAKLAHRRKNYTEAMNFVLIAYESAKENKDHFWIARTAELISDIFLDTYNYSQSEIYTIEAIEHYTISEKKTNLRYALCDLATIYLNENREYRAVEILDSLYTVCNNEIPTDSIILEYIKEPRLVAKIETRQLQDLNESDINIIGIDATVDEKIDDSIRRSHILTADGDFDSSNELLSEASILAKNDEQKIIVMYAQFKHDKATGNYQKATFLADTLLYLQSEIADSVLRESVTGIQRDFYSNKAIHNKRKSQQLTMILIAVIGFALTITALIWIIYRLKIRNRKTELESAMTSLMLIKDQAERINIQNKLLSDSLKEKSKTVTELKKELNSKLELESKNARIIETLFKDKWSTLNMLCNEYFEIGSSENTRNAILNNIEEELKKLQSKKNLKQLEDALNNYFGGIMTLLRTECTFLKEEDYTFLSLIFAGFSVRAVCLFTNIKYKHYYLKKSRLTKKIMESSAPHKDTFLNRLSTY
ncbi:MAG: hypothetical protein K2L73_00220 [Muribaculaceae bacterium]|nr:hypothetical protein [Muribaculaceae bacterium]